MPIDYKKYPDNWKTEIRPAILERAGHCCEKCKVENYSIIIRYDDNSYFTLYKANEYTGIEERFVKKNARDSGLNAVRIVLTISHTDHDVTNNDPANLRALCQRCHLRHDKHHHAATRKSKKNIPDLFK